MTTEEFLTRFVGDQPKMEQYRQGISGLHKIGFEDLLRRLAEPVEVDFSSDNAIQKSSLEHVYRSGWRDCVNTLFDIEGLVQSRQDAQQVPSFGAEGALEALGYEEKSDG